MVTPFFSQAPCCFRIQPNRSTYSVSGFDFQINALRATHNPISELQTTKLVLDFAYGYENVFLTF